MFIFSHHNNISSLFPSPLPGEARATINRAITAIAFSTDREHLYGATTSGDYVIASLRSHKIVQAVSLLVLLACDMERWIAYRYISRIE